MDIEPGNCFNCNDEVGGGDYCYGCNEYVCEDCNIAMGSLGGLHSPEDHLYADEDDDLWEANQSKEDEDDDE